MTIGERRYVARLSHVLSEVERLIDRSVPEQVMDAARLREVITLLDSGDRVRAQLLMGQLSPWAGEISIECGQL